MQILQQWHRLWTYRAVLLGIAALVVILSFERAPVAPLHIHRLLQMNICSFELLKKEPERTAFALRQYNVCGCGCREYAGTDTVWMTLHDTLALDESCVKIDKGME